MRRSMRRESALRENQGKPHQGPSCKVIPTDRVGARRCQRAAESPTPTALCVKPPLLFCSGPKPMRKGFEGPCFPLRALPFKWN